jgi:hypothetical protein
MPAERNDAMRRSIMFSAISALAAGGFAADSVLAGPYAPAAGISGSTAIHKDSPLISTWATGYQNYSFGPNVDTQWRNASLAIGPAVGNSFDIVALGDGGAITLTFAEPVGDGAGFDFAIFENSFNDTFLELAWVEVSPDGENFLRFNNDSLTPSPVPFIGGSIDPTNIDGLAGKYRQGYGTPFDLASVGLSVATHVRIVDIFGDGTARDSTNDVIYDPTPTVGSGGFDLDAVGVLHEFNHLPGDADLDGDVDLADLGALAASYGQVQNVTWSKGNFDFDTDVDLADLGALAANYGAGIQQALADFQSLTHTPEPSTVLPALALAAMAAFRRARKKMQKIATTVPALIAGGFLSFSASAFAQSVDFEDLGLAPNSYYNGSDLAGGFTSRGATFQNVYDTGFNSWYGFASSNVVETTTPGYGNQYAAITGGGFDGSANYAMTFDPIGGGYGSSPRIDLNQAVDVAGLYVTNSTYGYFAMADGNDGNPSPFVRQFGDDPELVGNGNQSEPDYCLLTITGLDGSDQPVGVVDFYLADYRFTDNGDDYVVDSWEWVDLSSLGEIAALEFTVTSTDMSFGYLNTPAYFAIDNLTLVPEPTAAMLALGALSLLRRRR